MQTLRKSFFFLALGLITLAVVLEIGGTFKLSPNEKTQDISAMLSKGDSEIAKALKSVDSSELEELKRPEPPGLAILYMALLDSVVLFTTMLMGASMFWTQRVHGRTQGCITLAVGVGLLVIGLVAIFTAIGLLIFMVSLLLSVPFGTITYMALFGFFARARARLLLSLLMVVKLGFASSLVLAHQRFVQNRGLVLLVLSTLLANIVVSFLHSFEPVLFVSITDAIGAILIAACGLVWAALLVLGSIGSVLKALRLDQA